ncbi:hypothetical protein C823_000623 [Eubacterium plexicaudatum ASF492]|uniref:AAA-ATPase-like domain-containing protein n=1 Tax=Eubacterium plexicaudatum ASF492 TaxID=1235802 RepID=N2A2K1_9FIRM|nr:hypothetical protein C823_000623 [Eubacterium plexicaudatum ASF492]
MGIYLNPGNKSFQQSVRSKIYVDKTNLIACTNERLNTKDKYICVSRPRRFGKSMALEMLAAALREIFVETDREFIFLIDEWDCIMRERQESEPMQKQYLDFLRNLLKDQPYVALVYMTGILPVKKYGQHSALNMFWEYSMIDQADFEPYTGFTEEEVKVLCERFDMNFDETCSWYDGYTFTNFKHLKLLLLTYNDENSLGFAIGLAYYSARKDYKLIRELPAGKGFADIAFLPLPHTDKPALLVELKYHKCAHAAIRQMKDRQYTQAFEDYTGKILPVGINYEKDNPNKPHSCVIEVIEKTEYILK